MNLSEHTDALDDLTLSMQVNLERDKNRIDTIKKAAEKIEELVAERIAENEPCDNEGIRGLVDQYSDSSNILVIYGTPIDELNREELLASIHYLMDSLKKQTARHHQDMKALTPGEGS